MRPRIALGLAALLALLMVVGVRAWPAVRFRQLCPDPSTMACPAEVYELVDPATEVTAPAPPDDLDCDQRASDVIDYAEYDFLGATDPRDAAREALRRDLEPGDQLVELQPQRYGVLRQGELVAIGTIVQVGQGTWAAEGATRGQ